MCADSFIFKAPFPPRGDQPQAIESLVKSLQSGRKYTTLLGATGTGKTFTVASVIARLNRPALVISPNKTLAAQLTSEFKEFFPDNAVEYFVSYFDYYRPEAYLPQSDSYIEKDSALNEEIDRLRHSAIQAAMQRRDVLCVASVSCIYGLGNPEDYKDMLLVFRPGQEMDRQELLHRLIAMFYTRTEILNYGCFRMTGDILDIYPIDEDKIYRIEFFGDEVDRMKELDPVTMETTAAPERIVIAPAKVYVMPGDKMARALESISEELAERLCELRMEDKLLEAQRLEQRTNYDLEVLQELGYCSGIENYSRHLTGRRPGEPPYTLLDYFPEDYVIFIDESHVAVPQLRAMLAGDASRKKTLVEYGFRLPSAYDNRPLSAEEFFAKAGQIVFMSATPGPFEMERSDLIVEQIIRPTGLVDPEVEVRPIEGQIDDLAEEIRLRSQRQERVLVTTLTKKMAEDLTEYLTQLDIRVRYLHSDIDTLERIEILRDLRLGRFDVLVGINLLREGLDLPEVSLVAILDADKEGFLRSNTSLIQTIGRAARNVNGKVILYADSVTGSMQAAIDETSRRRAIQIAYNKEHNIVPQTVSKAVKDILGMVSSGSGVGAEGSDYAPAAALSSGASESAAELDIAQLRQLICDTEGAMLKAAGNMEFELAAALRDKMYELKRRLTDILEGLPIAAALELAESSDELPLFKRRRRSAAEDKAAPPAQAKQKAKEYLRKKKKYKA